MTFIQFSPLFIPFERRFQTFAVIVWILSIFFAITGPLIAILLCFTPLSFLVIVYVTWVVFLDRNVSSKGGRRFEMFRQAKIWNYFRDYFPIELVKTVDLDPNENYVIGYHPHGLIGCGAFANFATESTGFSEKFRGIVPYLLTLKANFFFPFFREHTLAYGLCDVSRESIQHLLTSRGKGVAIIIVVGGAEEALEAKPGSFKLNLSHRKGFIREALKARAKIIPCFSFGENDLFKQTDNPKGSYVRKFQEFVKSFTGISPVFFYGRGIFNYTFGLLPYRKPIHTVIGAPLPMNLQLDDSLECPSIEEIDFYHKLYQEELQKLFDKHKEQYGIDRFTHLELI